MLFFFLFFFFFFFFLYLRISIWFSAYTWAFLPAFFYQESWQPARLVKSVKEVPTCHQSGTSEVLVLVLAVFKTIYPTLTELLPVFFQSKTCGYYENRLSKRVLSFAYYPHPSPLSYLTYTVILYITAEHMRECIKYFLWQMTPDTLQLKCVAMWRGPHLHWIEPGQQLPLDMC